MPGFDVKLTGVQSAVDALREYGRDGEKALDRGLRAAAQDARSTAVKSIQRGPKTGRTYPPIRGRRGSPHTASAPGEAPATDTGRLANSIRTAKDGRSHLVGTSLEYGLHLEFGTTRMEPRPWLVPAVSEATNRLAARIAEALRTLRGGL